MTNSEIVSKIKRVLEDPEGVSEQELSDLASTFARSCKIVDAGLARANVCLQSGQLCETYRLLKAERFLEDSMTLMFSEFDDWQSICRALDLEAPVPISREASANLFVFDLEFEKVEPLYARYRRLELERASATKRLDAMYQIKAGLPNYEDVLRRAIRMLESQFETEMREVLMKMTPELALSTDLERIYSNLTSAQRETTAPQEMVQAAQSWRDYSANVATLGKLTEFVAQWRAASSDEECMSYNAEFERQRPYFEGALRIAPSTLTTELSELVEQAHFIEHNALARNLFRQKLGKLTTALGRREGADELANLLEEAELAADAAGASIPSETRAEVESRIHSLVAQKRRRRVAIVSAIVLLVAFFSVLIVMTTKRSGRLRAAEQVASEIEASLDAFDEIETKRGNYDQLARARDLIERNDATCVGIEAYDLAVQRYERTEAKERARQEAFQSAVEEIEERHERGQSAFGMLANLKKQIRTDAEQTEYNQLYNRDKTVTNQGARQRDEGYVQELQAITSEFDALEADGSKSTSEKARQLDRLVDRLARLAENEKFGVSDAYVTSRKALETKMTKTLATLRGSVASDELRSSLLTSVGDASSYKSALASAESKFEDDARAKGLLASAQQDVANAARADAWNRYATSHGDANVWAWNATTYERATSALASEESALSFAPEYETARRYATELKDFATRGGFELAIKDLRQAFADYSRPLWVLHSAEDEYYYVTSAPKDGEAKDLKYLMEVKGTPKDFNAIEFRAKSKPLASVVAPQYQLRKLIDDKLGDDYQSFIAAIGASFDALAQADEEALDPALKLVLLGKLSQCVAHFAPLNEFANWRAASKDKADVHFELNFMRPGKELRAARTAAVAALRSAPELVRASADARRYVGELANALTVEYRWVGFLDVASGAPEVVLTSGALPDGDLYVSQGAAGVATRCGDLVSGVATLSNSADWSKSRWTPVYLRVQN